MSRQVRKRAFQKLCVYICVGRGLGGALSVDGGWLPLPTRPQRYCDPASLVVSMATSFRFRSLLRLNQNRGFAEPSSRQKCVLHIFFSQRTYKFCHLRGTVLNIKMPRRKLVMTREKHLQAFLVTLYLFLKPFPPLTSEKYRLPRNISLENVWITHRKIQSNLARAHPIYMFLYFVSNNATKLYKTTKKED